MEYADYQHCAVCDCKAFYDANIEWNYQRAKVVGSICNDCFDKGYRLKVVNHGRLTVNDLDGEVWENEEPYSP